MVTRRERVVLEMEDQFTSRAARAAAAAALLDKNLDTLSKHATTASRDISRTEKNTEKLTRTMSDLNGELVGTNRGLSTLGRNTSGLPRLGTDAERTGNQIDRLSGRLALLTRIAFSVGPALVPIGGALIPVLSALTMGAGAAAGALTVTVLAVNGLGDAMKALDAYQLAPTQQNFEKLRETFDEIGPSAAHFVRYLDSIEPQLRTLQEAARAGLLPGWEAGIDAMLGRLPQVRRIIADLADEMGLLSTQAGQELAGPRFEAFFDYLSTDAVPTLRAFSVATGNVVTGIGNMLVAFAPMTRDFTGGMVAVTRAFADWSAGLGDNAGFQEFMDYIRATGPQVVQFVGQLALALAAVAEAAAPVGQIVLPALTALAKLIETIAGSDFGTPLMAGVAALSALRLGSLAWGKIAGSTAATVVAGNARAAASYLAVTTATQRATMSASALRAMEAQRNRAALVGAGKFTAVLGGLAIAGAGAADGIGLTNTASMALMGSFAGPWGAAVGGAVGVTMDLAAANDSLESAIRGADDAIATMDVSTLRAQLAALDEQMAAFDERTKVEFSWNPLEFSKQNFDAVIAGTSELISGIRESGAAKREETAAALQAGEANQRYARQAQIAGRFAGYTASEIRGMTEAMEEQRASALAAFDAVTQYNQALIDARKQAEKSSIGIRENEDMTRRQKLAVIANREALSGLISAWNNQGKAVANNVSKYREARGELIQVARDMGATRAEAVALADKYMEIPRRVLTNIEARGGQETLDQLGRIKRQAEDVAGDYRINFIVTQTNAINKRAAGGADGDPTTPYAAGGYVRGPGGPKDDLIPARLSNREYVIQAAAVEKYGVGFFNAVNAMKFATGGLASRDAFTLASGGTVATLRPTTLPDDLPGAA